MPVPLEQLRELIIALLPRLRRLAHAITDSAHSGDDLVQLCIESVLLDGTQWHSSQDFQSGLFSMLARVASADDGSRQQGTDAATPPTMEICADGTVATALRRAYASLPQQQRVAIALVVLEDLSYRDSASVLGVPLAQLTEQLWSGCERLQAHL